MCKIIGIHQPNFFPFSSLINKIIKCDIFVILSNSQFVFGNYQNRFLHQGRWYTMSVSKKFGELITHKKYLNPKEDYERIKRQLPEYKAYLEIFDDCLGESLAESNFKIIERICSLLDIKTELHWDWTSDLKGTDRLVDICRHFGASVYLSGPSGKHYLELEKFGDIKVEFTESNDKRSALEVLKERVKL